MDEAEQRFQRRYGMSLRELRDKKEPLTAVDRERVKNFASEWNELVDESRLLAYKARTFAPREMDVLYMANRSKNESVKLLTRLLRDEQQPLPKERFTVLLQLLIGKSRARKGISGVAEWSLQALRKDVFEDFRDAWMQAAERWRK